MAYFLKVNRRRIGWYVYRIRTVYDPVQKRNTYELQKSDPKTPLSGYNWKVKTSGNFSDAEQWSKDLGLTIHDNPNRIL